MPERSMVSEKNELKDLKEDLVEAIGLGIREE